MAFDWQAAMSHPLTLMGAGMMAGADPRRTGFGGIGAGILEAQSRMAGQAQLAAEEERARMLHDLQMRKLQSTMAQPKLGQTPLYFRDPQGNLRIGRFGPEGIQFPETPGMQPVKPVQTIGIGGQELIMPYGAEQPTGVIQRTLPPEAEPATRAAQRAATVRAEATEAAREELPTAETTASKTLRYVDELKTHPGIEAGTGLSSMFPVVPGSDRADFEARKNQLLGGVFLEAYKTLKGGGQITEVEGKKAEQAMARIDAATSKEDFVEALEDYQDAVRTGMEKLRKRAGQQTPTISQASGTVVDWSEL